MLKSPTMMSIRVVPGTNARCIARDPQCRFRKSRFPNRLARTAVVACAKSTDSDEATTEEKPPLYRYHTSFNHKACEDGRMSQWKQGR